MLLLQLRQLLLSASKVGFSCSGILLCGHMVQDDDVALLKMEAIQMVQRIFGLCEIR